MSVEPGGLNATHDPALKSHVAAANAEGADFPIQNLPHGVFSRGSAEPPRGAVAIGDQLLDMRALVESGLLQAAQEHDSDEVADMEAVGGGVEADISGQDFFCGADPNDVKNYGQYG